VSTGTLVGRGLAEEVRSRALRAVAEPALRAAVERLARVSGDVLAGLVFFGSRCTGAARANEWSAYDLFVVVHDYRGFYEALAGAGLVSGRPRVLALLSRWLPPTQCSLRFADEGVHVKAAVIRLDALRRETSGARRDHFCIGRLFQPARLVHARDAADREDLLRALVSAHRQTWSWVRPWLPPDFGAEAYGRQALRVSMSWEVRPEPQGRADALWEAQAPEQVPVLGALLGELEASGAVEPSRPGEARWRLVRPAGWLERLRLQLYFRRSLVRATTRWVKHVVTFEGWLDYIAQKAGRHGGEPVALSERERRWPWIFLWGRLFRYLRDKDRRSSTP
jgi:hypothetical protein